MKVLSMTRSSASLMSETQGSVACVLAMVMDSRMQRFETRSWYCKSPLTNVLH